jgi:diketogulonate reductase-like aldo/keto reductase
MLFIEANGARIPAIGLGTWDLRGRACARIVEQALRLGYRHIDTAQMYENEREVGEGLRASAVKRGQIFVLDRATGEEVWSTAARTFADASRFVGATPISRSTSAASIVPAP